MPVEYKSVADLWNIVRQYTWSPTVFKDNYRKGANFLFADLIAFDFDNSGYTIEQAKQDFEGFKFIIGTTKSHMVSKNGEEPGERFRLILPLDRRCADPLDYVATLKSYAKMIEHKADEACFEKARQFYPCAQLACYSEGEPLPVVQAPRDLGWAIAQRKAIEEYRAKTKMLPRHVLAFLEEGKVFGGSRNRSLYVSGKYLKAKGLDPDSVRQAFVSSPFNREGFLDREFDSVLNSLFKE